MSPEEEMITPLGLNGDHLAAIDALAALCNAHDGGTLRLNRDNLARRPATMSNDVLFYADGQLIGFLPLFLFDPKEAEVSGMVHPAHRRRGIFSRMDQRARGMARERGAERFLYMVERGSETGKGYVTATGATLHHAEYAMMLVTPQPVQVRHPDMLLRRAIPDEDAPAMTRILATAFGGEREDSDRFARALVNHPHHHWYVGVAQGNVVGLLNVQIDDAEAGIYGFAVAPEAQGRGYGRQILGLTISEILSEGPRRIFLEVATENDRALSLYTSCGFQQTTVYDYYQLPLI